ncbi:diguanylate cyclase domain-containing protein [Cryptosporangium sp. NPDC048952]|uniref:diguanylate cyclase domain-containing protein n=1 Tax=Cryptosporangium sp. NPDC048952 TaxID=3363961 RepID=UPI0037157192
MLATGGLLTAVAFQAVERSEDHYAGRLMDRHAADAADAVSDRVGAYSDTLYDLAAAVGAQPRLNKSDFDRITKGLDATRLPGAAGITFVVPATTAEVAGVQQQWRARGATDLTLRPVTSQTRHAFVVFERAFDGRTGIPGLDLTQKLEVDEALVRAWKGSTLAVSPAYQLIRDETVNANERQASFVFAVPVYSSQGLALPDRFEGWIVLPVRGQDFLAQILSDRTQGAVQVTLTEGKEDGAVLTSLRTGQRLNDQSLVRQRTLFVGQRRWQLVLWPTDQLRDVTDRGTSRLTLIAGAALTLVLALMTGLLAGSRSRALQRVEEATAALRQDIARREQVEAQLRDRERQLQHQAFHDSLTGLANRALFYDRLNHALAASIRSGLSVGLLFIDLDGFKEVNDKHGHAAGDTVLRETADRLRDGLRPADTVARFGGDEFAVILTDLGEAGDACTAAERIIHVIQQPIGTTKPPMQVFASVGVAVSRSGANVDDFVRAADTAMYAAKNAGKNQFVSLLSAG